MHHVSRTGGVAVLVATLALTTGCGGGAGTKPDVLQAVKAAHAAEASASAAIAALSSKLAALTSPAVTTAASAAAGSPASAAATPAAATPAAATPAATTAAATAGAAIATTTPAPANALLGGVLAATDVSKYCSAIVLPDVQALVRATVSTVINNPYQCGWQGTGLEVQVNPSDPDPNGTASLVTYQGHVLTGLGDKAEWNEPVTGATLPNLYAIKGKTTCYVQADDVAKSTVHYTGSDPFFKIADADSLAYATKEAKLCADVFAVG